MSSATPTQSKAAEQRRAFYARIAERADALKKDKMKQATGSLGVPLGAPVMVSRLRKGGPGEGAVIANDLADSSVCLLAKLGAMRSEVATTLEQIDHAIEVAEAAAAPAYPSIAQIQVMVARHFRIARADLCSARRDKVVILPRQIAAYLCKELTPFSLPALGKHFGGRDHTTILHAVRKIANLLPRDADVAFDVALLIEEITGTKQ
jgi:hypothetical protein